MNSFGKPWEALATVGPIPRHLERAEAISHFRMTFWEYTSTGLAGLLTRPAHSSAMSEWMATTCSNALDSLNIRQMTSLVGTGRLGVKRSRSQARALNK
ncbi:hypothetical protein TNCV_3821271 [Trichonephila clavipes]|nr:hypothetical protein TNCV_3821271 [Trichonephila clavipes]